MTRSSGNRSRPTDTPPLRTDTLADSIVILLVLTALQRLIGFGRSILFCRWLDADQLGQWDMAYSFLMLAAPLAVLSLSGSFGRYTEHYRRRRQLRPYLRRTAALCGGLALPAAAVIYGARPWFSHLVFGTSQRTELVTAMAVMLLAVIAMHFFLDLFNALRNVRLIAAMQFFNSVMFAVLGIGLLLIWRCEAISVVIAYGGANALASAGALVWLRLRWRAFPEGGQPLPHRQLWAKVVPFVLWMVLTSLLANLFEIVDRYMIVHYSTLPTVEALSLVGDYHSSRVVPLLFVSIAVMLAGLVTPHLSYDWEAGQKQRVGERLNLFLKLFAFALSAAGVAVMFAAPLLFGVAFRGKFAGGLAVLPWTLTYCSWFGLVMIAQCYLWCAEKARLASLALLIGLLANIGLNLLLLPRLGLLGAVLATTAANFVVLVLVCTFNHLLGFTVDRAARVVFMLPLTVCLGPWIALLVLIAVALDAVTADRLLSSDEKRRLRERLRDYLEKLGSLRPARKPAESGAP